MHLVSQVKLDKVYSSQIGACLLSGAHPKGGSRSAYLFSLSDYHRRRERVTQSRVRRKPQGRGERVLEAELLDNPQAKKIKRGKQHRWLESKEVTVDS